METLIAVPLNQGGQEAAEPHRQKKVKKLLELKSMRDRNAKHFQNSDGGFIAEVSIHSRHYRDSQGNWKDISNQLVSSEEAGFELQNEANSFKAHFAKHSKAAYLFKVKVEKNRSFAWGLENSNDVLALSDLESITYPEILQSTDLQYLPFSDGVKENIILKDRNAPHTYHFIFQSAGLIPQLQVDGSILLNDEKSGETELVLLKPIMMDAQGQMSEGLTLRIEEMPNPNRYKLILTAEEAWLNDPNRVYPVTIDPTVTTVNWYTLVTGSGVDTYIASNSTYKYYANLYMTTGKDVNLGLTRALVKFPLPTLPLGSIVTDGIFSLTKYTTTSTDSEDLVVARITSDWNPTTVEWGNKPSFDQNQETKVIVKGVPGSYIGAINFNVWSIVKGWLNGGLTNYGFMVMHNQEDNPLFFYRSSEAASGNPFLSITYIKDPIGLNPYWSYANTSVGSVNTFNGNFMSSVVDFTLPGRGAAINITRTYNSRGNLDGIFGKKWFSNLDMQLRIYSWGAVLLDSTGAERPFMLKSDQATYAAPDNYPMQLYKISEVYYIQEAYTETSTFQAKHPYVKLSGSRVDIEDGIQVPVKEVVELNDGKENKTTLTRSSGNIIIMDPSGRTATLTKNAEGRVSQITTSVETGKVKVSYSYSDGYLTSVTYDRSPANNVTIRYTWLNGLLYSLTDKKENRTYILSNSSNQVISVGPINRLANPGFELSPNGTSLDSWIFTVDNDAGSLQQFRPSSPIYGFYGLKITSLTKAGAIGWSYLYARQSSPVIPGTAYTLSAQVSTSNLLGRAFIQIEQVTSLGEHISYHDTRATASSGTSSWKQHKLTVTASANAATFIVYMEIDHDASHFGGEAYFDGAQLEIGSIASPIFQSHTDFRYGSESGYATAWITTPTGELVKYQANNYGNPIAIVKDPRDGKPVSRTELTWDAQDRLRSIITPNLIGMTYQDGTQKKYEWTYDAVGNPLSAKEPVQNRPVTQMTYYYNRLAELTQANNEKVRNIWDPVNLNLRTTIDQTLNSKAFSYDTVGNVTMESNLLGVADNRLLSSDFTRFDGNNQPSDWFPYTPAGATNRIIYEVNAPFGGSYVLKISPNGNPYAYQWTDFIDLTEGSKDIFTISGYIRTDQPGSVDGAGLNVYWFNANKSEISAARLFNVRSQTWQRYVDTLEAPAGAVYARIAAITYGPYDGYFDNIQFEKSELVRGYNLIENSSFEQGPPRWNASDGSATVVNQPEPVSYSGNYNAQISRSSVGTSYLETQYPIPVLIKSGGTLQDYTLTGFIKTSNVSTSSNGGAWLHIYFYDSAGMAINDYATKAIIGDTGWTKYVLYFQPPANTQTMKVRVELWNASGTANFDNIRLSIRKLVINNSYDAGQNFVTSVTDQLGNTVSITPDAYGQTKTLVSPSGETTSYIYNGQEQLTSVTDNAGNITNYTLDSNGNVTVVATATAYNKSTFQYDFNDNLIQEQNDLGNITSFMYDEGGRIVQKNNPNGTNVSTDYDTYGNLSQIQLSGGPGYEFGYDLEGQRTSAVVRNSSMQIVTQLSHSYDEVGNLTSVVEKDGVGTMISQVGSPSLSGSKMYSDINQLLGFDLKYGTNTYTYKFSYTKSNLIKEVVATEKTFSMVYDESNHLTAVVYPDSTVDVNTYNEAHQVVQTQTIDSQNQPKWLSTYQYDKDGRLVKSVGTGTGSPSTDYVYNNGTEKLNRLTQAVIRDKADTFTFDYSYDPAGNLLTMTTLNGTLTFSYDHANGTKNDNRIYSINGSSAATGHDTNGNLTKLLLNGKTTNYVYDSANRLIQVKDSAETIIASYTYDGDGQRLTKTANGETITYHYLKGQLLYETSNLDPANTIRARYFWGQDEKMLGVRYYKPSLGYANYYYFHYNALGDIITVTDSLGNVQREYVYDPYGNIIKVRDGNGNPVDIFTDIDFNHVYTYRGYRFDRETGLYYLNARYYHPGIGRFLTKDTWKGVVSDPQSLNRYIYAAGDPINFVDSNGNAPIQIGPFGYKAIQKLLTSPQYRENVRSSVGGGSNNVIGENRKNDEVSKQVNNANKTLLGAAASIGEGIAKKSTSKVVKGIGKVGALGAVITIWDFASDYYEYGENRWYAMSITGLGAIITGSIVASTVFLSGGTIIIPVLIGTAVGVLVDEFVVDPLKQNLKSTP